MTGGEKMEEKVEKFVNAVLLLRGIDGNAYGLKRLFTERVRAKLGIEYGSLRRGGLKADELLQAIYDVTDVAKGYALSKLLLWRLKVDNLDKAIGSFVQYPVDSIYHYLEKCRNIEGKDDAELKWLSRLAETIIDYLGNILELFTLYCMVFSVDSREDTLAYKRGVAVAIRRLRVHVDALIGILREGRKKQFFYLFPCSSLYEIKKRILRKVGEAIRDITWIDRAIRSRIGE